MSQPFYDGKKAAEQELERLIKNKELPSSHGYKIKAKIVYTYEPTEETDKKREDSKRSLPPESKRLLRQPDIYPTESRRGTK